MTKQNPVSYAVIGAGHGGQALAAYLAFKNHPTVLYNRTESVVLEIKAFGGIELFGIYNTKVSNIEVTSNLEQAIKNADIIMICVPAFAHQEIAHQMAPYLKDNQMILINPGRTLGAYMFERYVKEINKKTKCLIAEADTFIMTSRKIRPGLSQVFSLKKRLQIAATDPKKTKQLVAKLSETFDMIVGVESMVITSLSNIGAIFHPLPALLNIGRIESGNDYLHYKEGITPMIADLLEQLDQERIALAKKLDYDICSAKEWLTQVYGSTGTNLYETLQKTTQYDEVYAPQDVNTRYVLEDVPTGIVPMLKLAQLVNSPHQTMKMVLSLANLLYQINFETIGRSQVFDFYHQHRLYSIHQKGKHG